MLVILKAGNKLIRVDEVLREAKKMYVLSEDKTFLWAYDCHAIYGHIEHNEQVTSTLYSVLVKEVIFTK